MLTIPTPNKYWLLPDLSDIFFILVLCITFISLPNNIFCDGSTGWHLVSGNYILQHHQVPHTDIISYTFANKAWVAYEWLSDLIMAILVKVGGFNLLAVVVNSAIAFLLLLVFGRCRKNGCNFIFAIILTILATSVSAIHWLARPHLFTFFGVYIFSTQLDNYYRNKISGKKLAIYLCLSMLVWVNCHPGFLIGLGLIIIYLGVVLIEYLFLRKDETALISKTTQLNRIKTLTIILALNILTTFCNPCGSGLYSYIAHYLFKTNAIISATDEFLSPIFHGAIQPTFLEILFAFFLIGLVINKGKISLPDLVIYIVFTHMSLSAQRNMALYIIVALPIIARLYSETIFSPTIGSLYQQLNKSCQLIIAKIDTLDKDFTTNEKLCHYHLLPMVVFVGLVCIALNGGQVFGFNVIHGAFPEKAIPNKILTIIKDLHLNAKQGLSMDNWGGVIKYKLDYPVFIDDRADFYGEDFYNQYGLLAQTQPGWQKMLDKYKINWVLMRPNSRLVAALKTDSQWRKAGEDEAAVLMVRENTAPSIHLK